MGSIRSALLGLFFLSLAGLNSTLSSGPSPSSFPPPVQVPAAPAQHEAQMLGRLLALAADYCARLSRASIDFVCLEDVSETIHDRAHGWPSQQFVTIEHNYLYDYQFIVENGQKTEKRLILERDGIKKKAEVTDIDTLTFYYKNVLFGAVDLLDGSRQSLYRYETKGRETLAAQPALVIEAVPVPGLGLTVNRGTVWLREGDGAILKIVWDVTSMGDTAAIRKTAKEYGGTPRILQVTEFEIEKGGIRFPNRFHIEEAYITKSGKKRIRSVLDAVYRDYKFFTVEVETGTIKRP
jgi:hypothetical protein